jgi:hypothetical protein
MTETAAKKAIKAHLMLKTEVKKRLPHPSSNELPSRQCPRKKGAMFSLR